MTDPVDRLAAAIEEQNNLRRSEVDALEAIADSLEDRVVQEGLKHDLEIVTEEGRRRQS